MARTIPERNPVEDHIHGVVFRYGDAEGISLSPIPEATTLAEGPLIVRYGVRLLGKSHISIVPGLLVLDYGDILTGEVAWDFLLNRSNLYPRAEVVGYRHDGTDDMVFIRQLDLAIPPMPLVFNHQTATQPFARPTVLIAPADAALPERLTQYLPHYDSLAAWQAKETR